MTVFLKVNSFGRKWPTLKNEWTRQQISDWVRTNNCYKVQAIDENGVCNTWFKRGRREPLVYLESEKIKNEYDY